MNLYQRWAVRKEDNPLSMKNQRWMEEFQRVAESSDAAAVPTKDEEETVTPKTTEDAKSVSTTFDELKEAIQKTKTTPVKNLLSFLREYHHHELNVEQYEQIEELLLQKKSSPEILRLLIQHGPMPQQQIVDFFHSFLFENRPDMWTVLLPFVPHDELVDTLRDMLLGKFVVAGEPVSIDVKRNWTYFEQLFRKAIRYLQNDDVIVLRDEISSERPELQEFAALLQSSLSSSK